MAFPRRAPAAEPLARLDGEAPPDRDAAFTGATVRELRTARQLTLKALAGAADLSVGYLSQIERGLSSPSVNALHALANALGVTIGWFFRSATAEGKEGAYVVRSDARRKLRFASGIIDELLSPHLGGQLELIFSRFAPGAVSGVEPYTHRGEEAGVVMTGSLELWIDDDRFELRSGDSFSFPSSKPHRYRNPTAGETVVIWVITPPTY